VPPTVTVLGDATLDIHVTPAEPIRPGGDVPATITLEPGGQGANVAVRLARRGVGTRLVCAIGSDAAGTVVRGALSAEGLDLHDLGAGATGTVIVMRDASGERTMLSQRIPVLERVSTHPDAVFGTDWLVVSGYVLLEAARGLSATGASPRRVVLGCSLAAGEVASWTDRVRSIAPHLVVLNTDEAAAIVGGGTPTYLADRVARHLDAVAVVTRATGATASLDSVTLDVAGRPVARVVDATGAGDAFAAALVAELTGGEWPPTPHALERAMEAGAVLGAAVIGVAGAQGRVPGEPPATLSE
jgi:sugar/nucleoside kinase (ribokinase family)